MRWDIADLGIIRWAAWYLGKGISVAKVLRDVMARWSHLGYDRAGQAVAEAVDSLAVAQRFREADRRTTLREMASGLEPPSENVSVSVLFRWFDTAGRVQSATVKVPTRWSADKGEVIGDAQLAFASMAMPYDVYTTPTVDIVGGIWTPSDEQM